MSWCLRRRIFCPPCGGETTAAKVLIHGGRRGRFANKCLACGHTFGAPPSREQLARVREQAEERQRKADGVLPGQLRLFG